VTRLGAAGRWLEGGRRALQFLDPPGRGKTTHLLALRRTMPESAFVRARDLRVAAVSRRALLLDDAHLVAGWRRALCWTRAGAVALTTPRDLTRELRLFGFEVRTERPSAAWTPERLHAVVTRRVDAARLHHARGPAPDAATLDALYCRYGTDARATLDALYFDFQHREACAHGEV
jgi:hypothetical protein